MRSAPIGYVVTLDDAVGVFMQGDSIVMDMDNRETLAHLVKVMGRKPDELGMGEIGSDETCATWRNVSDEEVLRATLFADTNHDTID